MSEPTIAAVLRDLAYRRALVRGQTDAPGGVGTYQVWGRGALVAYNEAIALVEALRERVEKHRALYQRDAVHLEHEGLFDERNIARARWQAADEILGGQEGER